MKKLIFFFLILSNINIYTQNVKQYTEIKYDKVEKVKYIYNEVSKSDSLNYNLFYPETSLNEKYNLIDIILYGIHFAGLTPFKNINDEFAKDFWIITEQDVHSTLNAKFNLDSLPQDYEGNFTFNKIYFDEKKSNYYILKFNSNNEILIIQIKDTLGSSSIVFPAMSEYVITNDTLIFQDFYTFEKLKAIFYKKTYDLSYNTLEINSFVFKEVWFYDKKDKIIAKQIIAICPIREYSDLEGNIKKDYTFWIYFPEVQEILNSQNILEKGSKQITTLNDFLVDNKYSGKIIKTEDIELEDYFEFLRIFQNH